MLRFSRRSLRGALLILTTALASACGNEPNATGPTPVADVETFVASLGSWEAFAPPLSEADVATGSEVTVEEVVDNTTYQCTVEPRSLTTTPREIVMYEPNASIMWVGNLIQGDSYKGGTGSFEELSIRQRSPLKISIDLLTGDNFAIVDNPSLTSVQAAIGGLIQKAADAGHLSGSSVTYESWRMYHTLQAIQKAGLSANFIVQGIPTELGADLGWEAKASLRGVFAHFTQKMFTISIELPQSPGDMFSDALTPELLQAQIDAGNIGPNNLPVYIANITYGRTLSYSLISADAEARLHAAVEASIKGFKGVDASGYAESELRTTLGSEYLRATSIGGEGQNVIDLIREGELAAYFTEDAPLTSARPISYQLNYLGNNSVAKVSETTDYDLRTCNEKAASPGMFAFGSVQSEAAGVTAPYSVHRGDFNGDGRGDLVLSHLQSGQNQMRVGLGNVDGTFSFGAAVTHPDAPVEGWADGYRTNLGDFDGDGSDDLVWDRVKSSEPLRVYVALSDGSGGFTFLPPEQFGTSWASTWETRVGNVDGDADDDLVYNYRSASVNYTVLARSDGDGTFTHAPRSDHPVGGNWAAYDAFVADVDGGTQRDDLIWNYVTTGSSPNHVFVALSNGDGTLSFKPVQSFLSGWDNYTNHMGDINADGRADLVWAKTTGGSTLYIHRALGQASGTFALRQGAQAVVRDTTALGASGSVPTYLGDFDGDGDDDVLFNRRTATANRVVIGLGAAGDFAFTPAPQAHPAVGADWTQFAAHAFDVTGDGRDDIVWIRQATPMEIYVARSQ